MNIAIIPARGGSKIIKKKNIKIFFSKPMIYWTIDILKKSKLFKKIGLGRMVDPSVLEEQKNIYDDEDDY